MIELATLGGSAIQHDGSGYTGLSARKQKIALLSCLAVDDPEARDTLHSLSPQTVFPCARRASGGVVGIEG